MEIDFGPVDIRDRYGFRSPAKDSAEEYSIVLELTEIAERTSLCGFTLKTNDHVLKIEVGDRGVIEKVEVNGEDFSNLLNGSDYRLDTTTLVPQIRVKPSSEVNVQLYNTRVGSKVSSALNELAKIYKGHLHGRTSDITFRQLSRRLNYVTGDRFFKNLKVNRQNLKSWDAFRSKIETGPESALARRMHSLVLISHLPDILYGLQRNAAIIARDISYVGPSRATGERYYRIQELAIDAIDPQGKNLAMFLHSLTAVKLSQFSDWLAESIGYEIKMERSAGHVQIKLRPMNGGEFFNIADMGYGFSQILPVMAQIWLRSERLVGRRIGQHVKIAIEQPELHLHPAYQALFADTVVNTVRGTQGRISTSFVIETHSEAMINRFGDLILRGKVKHDDIAIYIFEKDSATGSTSVRHSGFDSNGILENWPIGFFSSRIAS